MCTELDPWTHRSQLSQLDLKSTWAFQPYVCFILSLACEHCLFPQRTFFSPWSTQGANSSTLKPKEESKFFISFTLVGLFVHGGKNEWGQDYTCQLPSPKPWVNEESDLLWVQTFSFLNFFKQPATLPWSLSICFYMLPTEWALSFVSIKYGKESSVFKNPSYYIRYFYAINQLETQDSGHHSLIMSSFSK